MHGPYLNNSSSLNEVSESYAVLACLFLGKCQEGTWFLFPMSFNGRERSAPKEEED